MLRAAVVVPSAAGSVCTGGTSGSNGGPLAPYTEECPGASWQSPQHWVVQTAVGLLTHCTSAVQKPPRGHWRAVGLGQPAAPSCICAVAQPLHAQSTIS